MRPSREGRIVVLVEQYVGVLLQQRANRVAVPDVYLDESRAAGGERTRDVRGVATQKHVDRDDFPGTGRERAVDDVRSDRSRATGDDDARARKVAHTVFLVRLIVRWVKPRSSAPRSETRFASP